MEPANPKDYIYAKEQDRKAVTVRRFFADQGGCVAKIIFERRCTSSAFR
jgi:hypothetical protein